MVTATSSEIDLRLRSAAGKLQAAGVELPLLEAELLLGHALGTSRLRILIGLDRDLTEMERERFEELVHQRCMRVPLAYLRGSQEFYGLEFLVGPGVLIPRPETELLVDFAREKLVNGGPQSIVDFGTGSGCIAVAAAAALNEVKAIAIDASEAALRFAAMNVKRHGMRNRVTVIRSRGMDAVAANSAEMILSNPPYVPTHVIATLEPEIRDNEPVAALDGGEDGLDVIREIVEQAPRALRSNGWLAIEVGLGQAEFTTALMGDAGLRSVVSRKDLAGIDRMVIGQKP